jgi:hypothetical protein
MIISPFAAETYRIQWKLSVCFKKEEVKKHTGRFNPAVEKTMIISPVVEIYR